MATPAATKRLGKEYASIQRSPPPYIIAHPSESNILEWHYILTGPPDTPYAGGQYWGTLLFPPDYPFAPPAIRMHTPSGRFQPSARLCLSISDFHPKNFNPAWEVSTILIGLMSFMTGEEMTTGSVRASDADRRAFAARSRWWNSTGGGSTARRLDSVVGPAAAAAVPSATRVTNGGRGAGAIKAGDGGAKFALEWPEHDEENWKWMRKNKIDPQTGYRAVEQNCSPEAAALRKRLAPGSTGIGAVVEGGQQARNAGQGWIGRNKWKLIGGGLFVYVVLARWLSSTPAATQ